MSVSYQRNLEIVPIIPPDGTLTYYKEIVSNFIMEVVVVILITSILERNVFKDVIVSLHYQQSLHMHLYNNLEVKNKLTLRQPVSKTFYDKMHIELFLFL